MFYYLGKREDEIVPLDVVDKRNKEREWKYGYDPEYDLIVISKNGTLGPIFRVNELNIGLPQKPSKKQLLFSENPPLKQKWKRSPMPSGITFENFWHNEFEEYISEEVKRKEEGVWISVKGMPLYLTGLAYYFYQWIKLDVGYPRFRVIQNELMLYWEACKADPRSYGIIYVKNRRFGWSSICNAELIFAGTVSREKELGLMSKSGADGKKMFTRLVRSFKKLPPFFQPLWDGSSDPKTELLLQAPTKKVGAANRNASGAESLETVIRYHNTTLNAMDGDTIYRSAIDEAGKFDTKIPFDQFWYIVNTSHEVGGVIKGKSMTGSTVNELSKGGKEFKDIYESSYPKDRNGVDRTASGLYNLFIPAQYCLENYIDQYGFAIVEDSVVQTLNEAGVYVKIGANSYLEQTLEGLKKNPTYYNEQMRKFPRTEEEAFRDAADDCAFNVVKLQEQENYNNSLLDVGYEVGNLYWENGDLDGVVKWKPDPEGRFKIAHHPPSDLRNKRQMRNIKGVKAFAPVGEDTGAFGIDPYDRGETYDNRGSLGAIHLFTKMNTSGLPNNAFILEYLARPLKVEDFFEDVIKVMVYYSMPVLCEMSNDALLKLIKNRGYRHFSLNNPFKNYKDLNPTERSLGGTPQQNQQIGLQQFYKVEAYIEEHIGVSTDSSIRPEGEMGYMPFNETLKQWKKVDVNKRTKYDAYISSSLALIANQRTHVKANKTTSRRIKLKRYDNSGRISRMI